MNIAVNTRFLLGDALEGYGYFTREVFSRVARQHPDHQFYFLFDRPYVPGHLFAPNVHPVVVGPPARHPVLWKWWYDVKLPLALRRIGADLFVSPDGYGSLTTGVPQCLVIHDLGFLHHPATYRKSHMAYYKRHLPRFVRKAAAIATVSQFSKKDIIDQYKVAEGKIDVVYSAAKDVFAPTPFEERQRVKDQYTGGREYFIYTGAIHPRKNLINLLKAFSQFKKRQQASWKLVLAGRLAWKNDEFLTLLKTYKYRDDVVLTGYLPEDELVRLVGSAYALVYPSLFEGFGVPVLEAMKCGVPPLASRGTSMEEIGGEAALYFNPEDPADIADKLMLIYKDEHLRSELIRKGAEHVTQYSWDRTAGLVWKAMMKALEGSGSESLGQ